MMTLMTMMMAVMMVRTMINSMRMMTWGANKDMDTADITKDFDTAYL